MLLGIKKKSHQAKLEFKTSSRPTSGLKRHRSPKKDSSQLGGLRMKKRRNIRDSKSKRKLVIKPFKEKPKVPVDFEKKTFKILDDAMDAIFDQKSIGTSQQELYGAVQSLCIHKKAADLFERVHQRTKTHTTRILSELSQAMQEVEANSSSSSPSFEFLSIMERRWSSYTEQLIRIRSVFEYLDRKWVINQTPNNINSLWNMGLQLFRDQLRQEQPVETMTVNGLLLMIERDRQGEHVSRNTLQLFSRMFCSLERYKSLYEPQVLAATINFYREESQRMASSLSLSDYLMHIDSRLSQETERVYSFLDSSTLQPLMDTVEDKLVRDHIDTLLSRGEELQQLSHESGLTQLFAETRTGDLALLYRLMAHIGSLSELQESFSAYIQQAGWCIVDAEAKNDENMISQLLDFQASLDAIIHKSFDRNHHFALAMRRAFEKFINKREHVPSELMAKFVDKKLRAGSKGMTEDELQNLLDRVMIIFKYIEGKDVFQAHYKNHLAKRLLLRKSASIDLEKSMIEKIKPECGSTYTSKLEGMFTDTANSKSIQREFREHLTEKKVCLDNGYGHDVEMHVQVLTTGCWPDYMPVPLNLPSRVQSLQDEFQSWYIDRNSSRKLTWQNSLSTCVLRAKLPKGSKAFATSGEQAVVLMLFNRKKVWKFPAILHATGIAEPRLKLVLLSLLSAGGAKFLLKKPSGRTIGTQDKFKLNMDFRHKLFRIKCNAIQMKETKAERKQTNDKVLVNRTLQIEAAIVRIMKMRQTLKHRELVAAVMENQLKFSCDPTQVKKRIHSLIDREYLERDENDMSTYHYVA